MPGITEIVQISSQLPLISSQHPSDPGSQEINKRGKGEEICEGRGSVAEHGFFLTGERRWTGVCLLPTGNE